MLVSMCAVGFKERSCLWAYVSHAYSRAPSSTGLKVLYRNRYIYQLCKESWDNNRNFDDECVLSFSFHPRVLDIRYSWLVTTSVADVAAVPLEGIVEGSAFPSLSIGGEFLYLINKTASV